MVDWGGGVFPGCLSQVQLFVSTCNGRPHLALQYHWLLPINCHFNDCKAGLVRFPCKTRYVRIPGFSFNLLVSNDVKAIFAADEYTFRRRSHRDLLVYYVDNA